jgi:hypothetical protein
MSIIAKAAHTNVIIFQFVKESNSCIKLFYFFSYFLNKITLLRAIFGWHLFFNFILHVLREKGKIAKSFPFHFGTKRMKMNVQSFLEIIQNWNGVYF